MSDQTPNRADVILRIKGVTPAQADAIAAALTPLARQFNGTLNISDILQHADHAVQVGRRKIV